MNATLFMDTSTGPHHQKQNKIKHKPIQGQDSINIHRVKTNTDIITYICIHLIAP